MDRLNELWNGVDGPGTPPRLNVKRVKARVNTALDANQTERKVYMKQRLRTALIAAAAVAALTGSAFAATIGWNGLANWFRGNTTPVQEYVDSTVRSVSDEDYTLTVEGMVADEGTAYLTVAITALSDKTKEFLWDETFVSIDTFEIWVPDQDPGYLQPVNCGFNELKTDEENTRRFALEVDLPYPVDVLYVWCGYMEEGKRVEAPISDAVPSVTVEIGATGPGRRTISSPMDMNDDTLTIDKITLSPFTCHVQAHADSNVEPNICLRMADGSVLTQAQLMTARSSNMNWLTDQWGYDYRFKEIQSLDDIISVIVFDMEYPLDGSKPTSVEHDATLDPITVTRMNRLGERTGYSVPVRELTEKLGGTCAWDSINGNVTCTYRGVSIVLQTEKTTALVDGEPVDLANAPAEQDGVLTADWLVFNEAWGLNGFVQREDVHNEKDYADVTIIWGDWYIIP